MEYTNYFFFVNEPFLNVCKFIYCVTSLKNKTEKHNYNSFVLFKSAKRDKIGLL